VKIVAEAKKQPSVLVKLGPLLGVLGVILYFSSAPPAATAKTAKLPFLPGQSKSKKDLYLKEDYTAEFASFDTEINNSFKPLIVKKDPNSSMMAVNPNGIPSLFAGGDPNWIYTGNMTVDGVPNALLENTSTGEGVFLRPNERWRKLVMTEVLSDAIVLTGPNGYVKTVRIGVEESMTEAPAVLPLAIPSSQSNSIQDPASPRRQRRNRDQGLALSGNIGSEAIVIEPLPDPRSSKRSTTN
jgi:hypothetical protein